MSFEIFLDSEQGSRTGAVPHRAMLPVEDVGSASFDSEWSQISMSLGFLCLVLSESLPQLHFLGDTTLNQAILATF